MVRLSVNVNKVATLRNSRGGRLPSVLEAVRTVVAAGAPGITVHPRADQRHITPDDVHAIAAELRPFKGKVEYNIEGDPRPELLDLVLQTRPDQCTLVPVLPGEITSQAGWSREMPSKELTGAIDRLHDAGVRISLFVEPDRAAIEWAASLSADRVELYTEPYARAFESGLDEAKRIFGRYADASVIAHDHGLGVNAGHDLDLDNLILFRTLPHLDEVSIGHAIISRAVFVGLETVVKEYLDVLDVARHR